MYLFYISATEPFSSFIYCFFISACNLVIAIYGKRIKHTYYQH